MQSISNEQLARVLGGTACSETAARFDRADKAYPSGEEDRFHIPFTSMWWKAHEYRRAALADLYCRPDRADRDKK